ncbi:MAG: 1-deoxy-D-xylulose-5-phosphate synthase [Planctomycetes bacterium]|nr:1-deoxy-D-xylulose-5-phosphate synthase [Planctomycetota bacterium]MBI3835079.1 1-deoxy-D-xylulose-5-phosphate synthase [Planctomycetota bacterium]
MKLLEQIKSPVDLRKLHVDELPQLAAEIRERILEVVGKNGGHLTSNLGVTELTIALHRVFDFQHDRLLWDVGHQCYPHKLLTGRNERFESLRKAGGVSGFPDIHESEYDLFNVGHAGTAIATAVGMARADEMLERNNSVVAMVGDASIVNGVAFEGLNQAGTLKRQFLVVLNDNEWGISPTQGAMAEYLAKFRVSNFYEDAKAATKRVLPKLPLLGKPIFELIAHLKEGIKATVSPGQVFEAMGLQYVGPVDGHDIKHLIEILEVLKRANHPVLLHVHTQKGNGCHWASAEPGKYHSPKPFVVEDGKVTIQKGSGKSWTTAFVDALMQLAEQDKRIYAMTAGMLDGTGLNKFAEKFPDRCRDIGIAESCTVDIAAGMAKAGLRPVAAIYSTFLQRAFDQVFQEVVLQGLPVMFCLDRAGLVGGDGPVHHGFLDITYLRGFPGMVLMAPMDEAELLEAIRFGLTLNCPCAVRYPRDTVPAAMSDKCPPFELGKSRKLREGAAATILAYGVTAVPAMAAAEILSELGIEATVVNARFAKPVDRAMVIEAFRGDRPVVTVEDQSVTGGFGAAILEAAQEEGLSCHRMTRIGIPADRFIAHGSRVGQLAECGLDATGIAAVVQRLLDHAEIEDAEALSARHTAIISR